MRSALIRLDAEDTWPAPLRSLLNSNLPMLGAYERARAEWDARMVEDVMARLMPSPDPYRVYRETVLAECESIMRNVDLVGYHCTRLREREIEDVRHNGLRSSSPELLQKRVDDAVSDGLLSAIIAEQLHANHQAGHEYRRGMIWFVFDETSLQCESGVERLFRSWGGEALYNSHEKDPETGPALRSIGEPCIVEAAIPTSGINVPVEERVMGAYLERRGISTMYGAGMEGYVRTNVPVDRILRVIRRDDPAFEHI